MHRKTRGIVTAGLLAMVATACADRITAPNQSASTRPQGHWSDKVDRNAAADWNQIAVSLNGRRLAPPAPPAIRLYAYLGLAQLRAAEDARNGPDHRSISAAIGGASAAILASFYPLDVAEIQDSLDAQQLANEALGIKHFDFDAGEAIGRAAAARVLEYSLSDRVGLANPGLPPAEPGKWIGTTLVRGGYLARPFFLETGHELLPPPPPAFGSAEFNSALQEVIDISRTRTQAQIDIVRYWAAQQTSAYDGAMNRKAVELIRAYGLGDFEAAELLFRLGAATFDAAVGCYNAKYHYWYIRPHQAAPGLVTVINAPLHPSYPSGHSCHSGAATGVLAAEFPNERDQLAAMADEASMSRLYAGIHYRFDMDAGLELGRAAAARAMSANLNQVAVR